MEHVTLIHLFKIFNVKIVARRLSSVMNGSQIITKFLKVFLFVILAIFLKKWPQIIIIIITIS